MVLPVPEPATRATVPPSSVARPAACSITQLPERRRIEAMVRQRETR